MKKAIALLLFITAFVLSGPTEPMNNSPGNLEYSQSEDLVAQLIPTVEVAQEYLTVGIAHTPGTALECLTIAPTTEVAQTVMITEVAPRLITREVQVDLILPIKRKDIYLNKATDFIRTPANEWTAFNATDRKFIKRGPPRTTPGSVIAKMVGNPT